MPSIFLSYRRDDSAGFTGRLADALEATFGHYSVFRDIDDIRPGEDFASAITAQLTAVDAVLVIIGPLWTSLTDQAQRRLDSPDDFVRFEVRAALNSGKPVIPVLVGGANMPTAQALPADIQGLAKRQAIILSDRAWKQDLNTLTDLLKTLLPTEERRPKKHYAAIAALLTIIAATLALVSWWPRTPDISGHWIAKVKYDWGDAYEERFDFTLKRGKLQGTATYLKLKRPIEQATVDGDQVAFTTHSEEILDGATKEVTHHYEASVSPDAIRFSLNSRGGYSYHEPIEFIATRIADDTQ